MNQNNNNNNNNNNNAGKDNNIPDRIDKIESMKIYPVYNYTDILNHFNKEFYAQITYDGIRVQIHKKDQELNIFFKNKLNVYPLANDLKIILLKGIHAESIILDCELFKIHPITKVPYGVFRSSNKNKQGPQAVRFFDCLYLNGESLVNKVYSERKKHLQDEKVLRYEPDRFEMVKEFVIPATDGLSVLSSLIDEHLYIKNQEGLVFKHPDHIYTNRNIGKWYKYKRTYLKTIDYDLAMIGASQDCKSILLGVFDKGENKFKSLTWCLCRSNDLSLKLIETMVKITDRNKVPPYLDLTSTVCKEKIKNSNNFKLMYWLNESSLLDKNVAMVEISVEELLNSTTHSSNISCRNPIFIGFRDPRDCNFKNGTSYEQLKIDLDLLNNPIDMEQQEQQEQPPKKPLNDEEYKNLVNSGILQAGEHYMDRISSQNIDCIDYIFGNEVSPNPESNVLFLEMKRVLPDNSLRILTKKYNSNPNWYHLSIKGEIGNLPQFMHDLTDNKGYLNNKKFRIQSVYFKKPNGNNDYKYYRWAHYSTFLNLSYSGLGIKLYVNSFEDDKEFKILPFLPESKKPVPNIPITRLAKKRNLELKVDEEKIGLKQLKTESNLNLSNDVIRNNNPDCMSNYNVHYNNRDINQYNNNQLFLVLPQIQINELFTFLTRAEYSLALVVGKGYFCDRVDPVKTKLISNSPLGSVETFLFKSYLKSQHTLNYEVKRKDNRNTIFKFKDLKNNVPQIITKDWYFNTQFVGENKKISFFHSISFIFDDVLASVSFSANIYRCNVLYESDGSSRISRCN